MPILPDFLIKRIPKQKNLVKMRALISDSSVHTVCESAHCPNLGECFSQNTVTFMILGNVCTRSCAFCAVDKGNPQPPDPDEPRKIAETAKKLGLDFVVITSVTRDDLPDFGAGQFTETIRNLRLNPDLIGTVSGIEVLIPDFQGRLDALKKVLDAGPLVLNHNIETVPRLYPEIRPHADYKRSLELLRFSKGNYPHIYTKSGIMVGLGETDDEVLAVLRDLQDAGCDIATIGQYLPPSKNHQKVSRYVQPEIFEMYAEEGRRMGFLNVFSEPFVRSSYKAREILWKKQIDY